MKLISYCIPVMNRTDDVKQTLKQNLSVVSKYSNDVEIVINCFDADDNLSSWVNTHFLDEIESGILCFNKLKPLPYWHFCWAKNSFKPYIKSKYYASLDGDNYLTETEVATTVALCKEPESHYLFHLFSGTWGDGTSGRIVVYREHYERHGYCDTLFPRQFDELALLFTVIAKEKVVFVSRKGINLFEQSGLAKSFYKSSLSSDLVQVSYDFGEVVAPMQPRGTGYVKKSEKLHLFQNINAFYAMSLIATKQGEKRSYKMKLEKQLNKLLNSDNRKEFGEFVFLKKSKVDVECSGSPTVYSVIKKKSACLKSWYEYYKKLGVKRFILVDLQERSNISEILPCDDIHVFQPLVGNTELFEKFWIDFLQKCYQQEKTWAQIIEPDIYMNLGVIQS